MERVCFRKLAKTMYEQSPFAIATADSLPFSFLLACQQKLQRRLVDTVGETSNQLFQILEDWNMILQSGAVDLSPSL